MKTWVATLYAAFRTGRRRKTATARALPNRCRLTLETLEDRCVPSTVSSITSGFNGTAIPAGDTVWFNAACTVSGLPKTTPATIHVEDGTINFTAGGVAYNIAVPNGVIVFTPGQTSAVASFDRGDNDWDVSVPSSGAGDVFMTGVAVNLPNGLPGGIKNVTWSAGIWSDTPNVTVSWKWAASAYKSFGADYNALNVKPVDSKTLSAYKNGDQSDTPEAFKSFLVAGGTGNGGTNYTGNFSTAKSVKAQLGDGVQDYPYPSSNPLTSIAFNESTVLRAANLDTTNGFFQLWYNDEHALALGVGTVIVKTSTGTTTTNYPITAMTSNPSAAFNPAVGSTATSGDQAGTDISGRPMTPSLFITDITTNPNDRSGDWQWGGQAYAADAVFGTWKSFTKTVDYTTSTPTVIVDTGVDPAKNNWNLGPGADPAPAGLSNEGYGAEVRWDLNAMANRGLLIAGHTYRFYVMVHDGDQNKVGGDAGQASFDYFYPGASPSTISGFVTDNGTHAGLANVLVTLTGTTGGQSVTMTTFTGPDGSYGFSSLQPGTYSLMDTPPATYFDFSTTAGTVAGVTDGIVPQLGTIAQITLTAGSIGVEYDFVDAQNVTTTPATLSGHVTDTNGAVLAGAVVNMRDSNDVVIQQVVTDANGFYTISDIAPGTYSLTVSKSGYRAVSATAGTDNGVPDGTSGVNAITDIGLNSGDLAVNYDFVLTPADA